MFWKRKGGKFLGVISYNHEYMEGSRNIELYNFYWGFKAKCSYFDRNALSFAYSNALIGMPFHKLRYVGVTWFLFYIYIGKIYPTTLMLH